MGASSDADTAVASPLLSGAIERSRIKDSSNHLTIPTAPAPASAPAPAIALPVTPRNSTPRTQTTRPPIPQNDPSGTEKRNLPSDAGAKVHSRRHRRDSDTSSPNPANGKLNGLGGHERAGLNRKDDPVPTEPQPPHASWRCRACHRSPCLDPVATACGHLFCHKCVCPHCANAM